VVAVLVFCEKVGLKFINEERVFGLDLDLGGVGLALLALLGVFLDGDGIANGLL